MTDADYIELYEERAAIRQYEGGQSKRLAEFNSVRDVRRALGFAPQCVIDAWERDKREEHGRAAAG